MAPGCPDVHVLRGPLLGDGVMVLAVVVLLCLGDIQHTSPRITTHEGPVKVLVQLCVSFLLAQVTPNTVIIGHLKHFLSHCMGHYQLKCGRTNLLLTAIVQDSILHVELIFTVS